MRVVAEDRGALLLVGQGEVDRLVEAAHQRVVQIRLAVRRADGDGVGDRVDSVKPAKEHREDPPCRLEHVLVAGAGERVDLVQEEDAPAKVLAGVEDLREVLR